MKDLKNLSDVQLVELYFVNRKDEKIRKELMSRKLSLKPRILKEKFFTTKSHNVPSPLQKLKEQKAKPVDKLTRLVVSKKKKK